jgi:hypothetical protein
MAARLDTGESPTDGNADPRMFFMAFAACKLNREEIERKMCGKKVNNRDRYDLNSSETVVRYAIVGDNFATRIF